MKLIAFFIDSGVNVKLLQLNAIIGLVIIGTETGSRGQRGMESRRKDVKNLLYSRRLLTE